jgi:Family of unknown function (DUF6941)
MTATPTLIDIWFCDDVREEKNGRYSLMGLYPSRNINTQQLPTMMSQFNIIMRFNGVQEDSGKLVVSISAPDEQESRPIQGRALRPLTASGEALFILCASPLQLSREGKHTIKIKLGESIMFQDYFNVVKTAN